MRGESPGELLAVEWGGLISVARLPACLPACLPARDVLGLRLVVRACACCGHDGHVNSYAGSPLKAHTRAWHQGHQGHRGPSALIRLVPDCGASRVISSLP
ncbi:hypothetical protein KC19_7G005300 [Ceratodon purpureus]|uniref:Uncharacterized protein n=1 Tax=Ceratodon purpureus TaxID=3225 RepID=A0A8T0H385_CERPU|nr:hypothetical protein KC19_7G005300 [Ceratodon purpureus]